MYRIIGEAHQGRGDPNTLLSMLLNAVDADTGERMTDKQLRDEVATLFVAGYETTSLALSWAYHFLTQQPEAMQKLQAEVDDVLGDRAPAVADLMKMPYTRMTLQEVLRIRPPSYWVPRTALADDAIVGYRIPKGATVVSLTWMYHHHPDIWEDPERFDPERFTLERSADRHPFAWLPFGAGNRQCIGRDFALMEGQLALAMIAQRYRVCGISGRMARLGTALSLRPKGGVVVRLERRW